MTEQHGSESRRLRPLELLGKVLNAAKDRQCSAEEELGSLRSMLADINGLPIPPAGDRRVAISRGCVLPIALFYHLTHNLECPLKHEAIDWNEEGMPQINADVCTGCGVCRYICPAPDQPITIEPVEAICTTTN